MLVVIFLSRPLTIELNHYFPLPPKNRIIFFGPAALIPLKQFLTQMASALLKKNYQFKAVVYHETSILVKTSTFCNRE